MSREEIEAEASKAAESILLESNQVYIFDGNIDLVRLAVKAAYIRGLTAGKIEEIKGAI